MRLLFLIAFILNAFISPAQTIKFKIQGEVKNTEHAKFAYLTTLSQQTTIASDKVFMVTPITNGKFQFNGSFDLEGKDYQYGNIIIDERGNITKEELASKFNQHIWITGVQKNIKIIMLEDLNLTIEERDQTINAKILNGGKFTKQYDQMGLAIRARNKKFLEFVRMYPDSPLTFNEVEETCEFIDFSNKEKIEGRTGSMKELYALLSPRIKSSKRGLALKKLIDEKSKE